MRARQSQNNLPTRLKLRGNALGKPSACTQHYSCPYKITQRLVFQLDRDENRKKKLKLIEQSCYKMRFFLTATNRVSI